MSNLMQMLGVIAIAVLIPLLVLLGIWADILPQSVQVAVGIFGVIAAAAFIIGGNLLLLYSDIKTGRYKKNS